MSNRGLGPRLPADRNLQETFVFISGEMILSQRDNQMSAAVSSAVAKAMADSLLKSSAGLPAEASAKAGGAYRDRTDDPLLAKQVLSQLS